MNSFKHCVQKKIIINKIVQKNFKEMKLFSRNKIIKLSINLNIQHYFNKNQNKILCQISKKKLKLIK